MTSAKRPGVVTRTIVEDPDTGEKMVRVTANLLDDASDAENANFLSRRSSRGSNILAALAAD